MTPDSVASEVSRIGAEDRTLVAASCSCLRPGMAASVSDVVGVALARMIQALARSAQGAPSVIVVAWATTS